MTDPDKMKALKPVQQYLVAGAVVPVDIETTAKLVTALIALQPSTVQTSSDVSEVQEAIERTGRENNMDDMPEEIWITSDGKPIWWGGGLSSPDSTKYLRASLTENKNGGWLDISTAPRDGTWILAFRMGALIPSVVQWETFEKYPQKWRDHLSPRWLPSIEGEYQDDDNAIDCLVDSSYDPTHWQPLPLPPSTDEHKKEG